MSLNSDVQKPKIWKMLFLTWVYAYIIVNLLFALFGNSINGFHPLLRSLIMTLFLVPAFGLGIPILQKHFAKWLMK